MGLGGIICISIGEYHQADHFRTGKKGDFGWRPSFGISGFISQGVVNGLLSFTDKDEGVRLKNLSNEQKKEMAKDSVEYNKTHNKEIMDLFQVHREMFPDLEVWK